MRDGIGPRPIVRPLLEIRDEADRPTTVQAQGSSEGGIIIKGRPVVDPPDPELVPILYNPGNTGFSGGY